MKQAVIFDMDGTVANTLRSIAGFGNAALEAHGFPPVPVERYRQLVGNGRDVLIRRLLAESGRVASEADFEAVRETYDALYAAAPTKLVEPYPGVVDLLRTLRSRGVKTAVLSNKPDDMTNAIAASLFAGCFDAVQGQRERVPKKPDPTAALALCASLGASPETTLYVGDSGVDMQTGRSAGFETVGVLWGFRGEAELRENGAAHLVRSAGEILALI